jgi:hypothetical protein
VYINQCSDQKLDKGSELDTLEFLGQLNALFLVAIIELVCQCSCPGSIPGLSHYESAITIW